MSEHEPTNQAAGGRLPISGFRDLAVETDIRLTPPLEKECRVPVRLRLIGEEDFR